MSGYRGFESRKAYEKHYSDPSLYADEIQSMNDYVNENEAERKSMAQDLARVIDQTLTFQDLAARHEVEIVIRHDSLVIWINVDGICRARIVTNGITVPITVEDGRVNK